MKFSHPKLTIAVTLLTAFVLCASLAFVSQLGLAQKPATNADGSTTKTEPDATYGEGGTKETTTTKDGLTREVQKDKDGLPRHASETGGKEKIDIIWQYDKLKRQSSVKKTVNGAVYLVRWDYKELTDKDKKEGKGPDLEGKATGYSYDDEIEEWVHNPASEKVVESNLRRFGLVLFPKIVHQTPKQKIPKIPKESGRNAEPTSAQGTATAQLVGLVYDKDSQPGQQVTVSLTTDPKKYENIPALGVIEMKVTASAGATAQGVLKGWVVELGDDPPQPANQPLTTQIAQGATSIPVKVSRQDDAKPAAQSSMPITQGQSNITVTNTGKASDFTTPPVCQNTSFIRGPLSGDAKTQAITVDNQPATIIAGSTTTVFFDLPPGISDGPHQLVIQDGSRSASFSIVRMGINGDIAQPELLRGQRTTYRVTVNLELPDSAWQHGGGLSPELTNVANIQKLAPGFHIPQAGEPGVVLELVENASREIVSIKPSQDETVVRALHQQDFQNNQSTISGEIQSKKKGTILLNLLAEAFFAPIRGEEVAGGMLLTTRVGGGKKFGEKKGEIVEVASNVELPIPPGWKCKQECPKLQTTKSGKIYCELMDACGGKDCPTASCHLVIAQTVQRDGKNVEEWGPHGMLGEPGTVPKAKKVPEKESTKDKENREKEREKEIEGHAFPPAKDKTYGCACHQ